METSVIIRTYNEERHLPALLGALARQRYRNFETLVVDSGSLDRTREIALGAGCRLVRINSHDFTFGFSLNKGVGAAGGRFAAIVSAHTLPCDEDWLERIVAPLRDPGVAMCYGRQLGVASSKFSENEDFRRTFGSQRQELHPPDFFANNANSAIRRDLWDQYPFDEALSGLEDIDWAKHWMERGLKVVYEPEAALYHIHEETWRQVRRRYYREVVAARRIGIVSTADVWKELRAELRRSFGDLWRAFRPGDNPTSGRLNLLQRLAEIGLFRFNKLYATYKGLAEDHPMETEAERYDLLFERSNRAVVLHGPRQMSLEETALPPLKPGDVLIRVAHVGPDPADWSLISGSSSPHYPAVPGRNFSGRIAAVGVNVASLVEDDPVIVESPPGCGRCEPCHQGVTFACMERHDAEWDGMGGCARYAVVPSRFVCRLPEGVPLDAAVLARPLAAAIKGVRRASGVTEPHLPWAVVGNDVTAFLLAAVMRLRGHSVSFFGGEIIHHEWLASHGVHNADDPKSAGIFALVAVSAATPAHAISAVRLGTPRAAILLVNPLAGGASLAPLVSSDRVVVSSSGADRDDLTEALRLLPVLNVGPLLPMRRPLDDAAEVWGRSRDSLSEIVFDVA